VKGNRLINKPVASTISSRHRVLVYCPEAYVGSFLLTLQVLARILADAGHEVLFSHCHRLFERCVAKESVLLRGDAPPAAGEQICATCIKSCLQLMRPANLIGFSLSKAIPAVVRDIARNMIDALPDASLANFVFDGVKFGEACRHDLILNRKLLLDTPLEPEHYLYLRQYLKTVVATYLGMQNFLPAAGFTDVIFYGQYAANIAVICAARKVGVNWRLVSNVNHLGVDRRRISIHHAQTHLWMTRMIDEWTDWCDLPLSQDEIEETGDDILIRFGGTNFTTYSPPKTRNRNVFSALGLDHGRRLVVAFTSSLDEYDSELLIDGVLGFPSCEVPDRPYADQIEWLTLLAREIGNRPDLQLVIRIHPREDANKREGVRSRHLDRLHQHLSDLPSNVTVVWPTDPVSSYDLIEVADFVQVWSSMIGLESARLGIPVLKVNCGYSSYPEGDFVLSARTHDTVLAAMDEALTWIPDFDRLVRAWRFYGYTRFASSLDLRDVVPAPQMPSLPEYRRPRRLHEITRAVFEDTLPWKINRQAAGFMDSRLSRDQEAASVRRQLRRVLHAVFTGGKPPADVPLHFERDLSNLTKDAPSGSFAAAHGHCTYVWAEKMYTRYSPMCARLAALSAQDVAPSAALAHVI
jgi:hypothetical protein